MTQAKELRIGNWIEFNNFISPPNNLQVTPRMFRQLGMDLSENLDLELSGYHKPIPLTEEWLIKFGFVWSIQHQAHYLKGFDYVIDVCDGFCRVIKYRRNGENLIDIKYVHQLQNLYFALTGEELIIK